MVSGTSLRRCRHLKRNFRAASERGLRPGVGAYKKRAPRVGPVKFRQGKRMPLPGMSRSPSSKFCTAGGSAQLDRRSAFRDLRIRR